MTHDVSGSSLLGIVVIGFVILDLIVFFGLPVIVRSLRSVKRLARAAHLIQSSALDKNLPSGQPLGVLASRLLFDFLKKEHRTSTAPLASFLRFPIGRIMIIAYTDDSSLKRIVKELQGYAFMVAILFVIGTIIRATQLQSFSLAKMIRIIGSEPFHTIDVLALFALMILVLRLVAEILRLSELLTPPH